MIMAITISREKKNKQELLTALYDPTGKFICPYGTKAKIAKELNISEGYVRQVLDPRNVKKWSYPVYKLALKALADSAAAEQALAQQAADVIKKWIADFESATQIMKEINNG